MVKWLDLAQKRFKPLFIYDSFTPLIVFLRQEDRKASEVFIPSGPVRDSFIEAANKGGRMLLEDMRLKDLPNSLRNERDPLNCWIKGMVLMTDQTFIDVVEDCYTPDGIHIICWKIHKPIESSIELCEQLHWMPIAEGTSTSTKNEFLEKGQDRLGSPASESAEERPRLELNETTEHFRIDDRWIPYGGGDKTTLLRRLLIAKGEPTKMEDLVAGSHPERVFHSLPDEVKAIIKVRRGKHGGCWILPEYFRPMGQ